MDSPAHLRPGGLARRAGLALLVHAALVLAWPLLRPLYAPAYRAVAEVALDIVAPWPAPLAVRLEPGASAELARDQILADTTVRVEHRELVGSGTFGASTFFHGWLPTSVLLALFLAATPRPWRARRGPLLVALLALHAFLLGRLVVAVLYTWAESTVEGRPGLALSPAGLRALRMAWHFVWGEMLTNYLAPLALWALCAFERGTRLADRRIGH